MNRIRIFTAAGIFLCLNLAHLAQGQVSARVGLQVAAGTAQVTLTATSNTTWTVQYSTTLAQTNTWLPLANVRASNSLIAIPDITGPVAGQKFYRAVPLPPAPTIVTNANLVWVTPGTFLMGSPANEIGRDADEVQHPVTISRGFFISKYLVTQGDFISVLGYNPSYFKGTQGGTDLSRPVEQAHWYAAAAYCAQLTINEQLAGRLPTNWVYRLPTEAEWEYACRAGSTNRFSYGDDPGYLSLTNYAWYEANSASITHGVGQKLPNNWNLYDVHGDVYEWCQDWYDAYPTNLVVDPQGPSTGSQRVFRGGGWAYGPEFCRTAGRYPQDPTLAESYIGFRVVASPAP